MTLLFLGIGLAAGLASGLFGLGGGVLIVPSLAFLAGFTQERAVGTSLAVLLPPVGLAAVLRYYRSGSVDIKAALWVALGLFVGAWFGAEGAIKAGDNRMRLAFGLFLIALGAWITLDSLKTPRMPL
jgi:uncharacterized membrane protein YfcA